MALRSKLQPIKESICFLRESTSSELGRQVTDNDRQLTEFELEIYTVYSENVPLSKLRIKATESISGSLKFSAEQKKETQLPHVPRPRNMIAQLFSLETKRAIMGLTRAATINWKCREQKIRIHPDPSAELMMRAASKSLLERS